MPVTRTVVLVALLSGGLAGLAGAVEVAGRTGYVTLDMSPGYGYSGIVIAMLAGLNPLGVVAAAVFVAGVLVGADLEPRHRRADLPGRRDRRHRPAGGAGGGAVHAVPGAPMSFKKNGPPALARQAPAAYFICSNRMTELLDILSGAPFWVAVLRVATPLVLGTLGVLLCERAGVLNLGWKASLVVGAFGGWLVVYAGHGLWTGVLAAALVGALFGLLHAALTVGLALSQHVSGLGITVLPATALLHTTATAWPSPR